MITLHDKTEATIDRLTAELRHSRANLRSIIGVCVNEGVLLGLREFPKPESDPYYELLAEDYSAVDAPERRV
jgi:hypothetical protein